MSKHDDSIHVYTDGNGHYKTLTDGSENYKAKALMLENAGFLFEVKGDDRIRFLDSVIKAFEDQGIKLIGMPL